MDTEAHELIAAYALDALDRDDRDRVEALLDSSAEAREELRSFAEVSAALAVGVIGPAPSLQLRDRILADARAEPPNVVPFERPQERRTRRTAPILSFAAAAAAVVAVGVGVWGISVAGELDDTRTALDRERDVSAVLSDPTARTVSLASGSGRLVVAEDGGAVLVVQGLDEAPAGKAYQVWIMEGAQPKAAGTFSGAHDRDVVPVSGAVRDDNVVAVTLEDAAGVEQPTSPPLLASQPV